MSRNVLNNTLNDLSKLVESKIGGQKKLYFVEENDNIDNLENNQKLFICEHDSSIPKNLFK